MFEKNTSTSTEVIKITANELMEEYESGELNADNLYKGKLLKVSGKITSIEEYLIETTYITLETNEIFANITCMLKDSELGKVSGLRKGDYIILTGRCSGIFLNVRLEDSVINWVNSN